MTANPGSPLVLLNPGPACTTDRVRAALGRGDWCHREPEFSELLASIRAGLTRVLNVGDTHEAIVVTGSGTSAMEMAVISAVRAGRSILVVRNGVYGDRLARIAEVNGITVHSVTGEWTEPADPEAVRAALAGHPDVDAVAVVQHETTTGMINPVGAIGRIAREAGVLMVVDAISATAIEDEGHEDLCADIICGTANKGLHGLPGISFILCSDKGIERLAEVPVRSLYLNANTYLTGQRKGDVPFTPAVQVCFALDEAIKELEERGGVAARVAEYKERAALVRAGLARLGLEVLIPEQHRSNSISMIYLPEGITYPELHDVLKDEGFVIYAGQGDLAKTFFRVSTMGELPLPTLERFLTALETSIAKIRAGR
ncbi:2-aminoethylphosphonate-pyruvate transaminase [Catenulispora sp. MAP5-51]|uniref:pyridoxal-phosphate-dependent aminotransferase family protein n=1 Tax=Catenulispora sp. MAP5-51 TaxID=3156298 RepID=UPI0035179D23